MFAFATCETTGFATVKFLENNRFLYSLLFLQVFVFRFEETMSKYGKVRLSVGDVVLIADPSEGIGVVRFINDNEYIVGIELTDPLGTTDGVRNGRSVSDMNPHHLPKSPNVRGDIEALRKCCDSISSEMGTLGF